MQRESENLEGDWRLRIYSEIIKDYVLRLINKVNFNIPSSSMIFQYAPNNDFRKL